MFRFAIVSLILVTSSTATEMFDGIENSERFSQQAGAAAASAEVSGLVESEGNTVLQPHEGVTLLIPRTEEDYKANLASLGQWQNSILEKFRGFAQRSEQREGAHQVFVYLFKKTLMPIEEKFGSNYTVKDGVKRELEGDLETLQYMHWMLHDALFQLQDMVTRHEADSNLVSGADLITVNRGQVINVQTNLRMRSQPNTSSRIIARLENETPLVILDKQGDWYKVRVEENEGYLYHRYVEVTEGGQNFQSQGEDTLDEFYFNLVDDPMNRGVPVESAKVELEGTVVTASTNLNVRDRFDRNNVVGSLPKDSKAKIVSSFLMGIEPVGYIINIPPRFKTASTDKGFVPHKFFQVQTNEEKIKLFECIRQTLAGNSQERLSRYHEQHKTHVEELDRQAAAEAAQQREEARTQRVQQTVERVNSRIQYLFGTENGGRGYTFENVNAQSHPEAFELKTLLENEEMSPYFSAQTGFNQEAITSHLASLETEEEKDAFVSSLQEYEEKVTELLGNESLLEQLMNANDQDGTNAITRASEEAGSEDLADAESHEDSPEEAAQADEAADPSDETQVAEEGPSLTEQQIAFLRHFRSARQWNQTAVEFLARQGEGVPQAVRPEGNITPQNHYLVFQQEFQQDMRSYLSSIGYNLENYEPGEFEESRASEVPDSQKSLANGIVRAMYWEPENNDWTQHSYYDLGAVYYESGGFNGDLEGRGSEFGRIASHIHANEEIMTRIQLANINRFCDHGPEYVATRWRGNTGGGLQFGYLTSLYLLESVEPGSGALALEDGSVRLGMAALNKYMCTGWNGEDSDALARGLTTLLGKVRTTLRDLMIQE